MIRLEEIRDAIDRVNVHEIPYDVGVFKSEKLIEQLVETKNSKSRFPLQFILLQGQGELVVSEEEFLKIRDHFKSMVVFAFFTAVHWDYTVRLDITHNLLAWLKHRCNYEFYYDDYSIWRKTAAVYAGLGKIGDNRLFFSKKFGFNCKIEMIMTNEEFETYYDFQGSPRLSLCGPCDNGHGEKYCFSEKSGGCSVLAEKTYEGFFKKCVTKTEKSKSLKHNPANKRPDHTQCYECVTGCPYSERLVERIPENIRYRRYSKDVIEWPFLPRQLTAYSFKNKIKSNESRNVGLYGGLSKAVKININEQIKPAINNHTSKLEAVINALQKENEELKKNDR